MAGTQMGACLTSGLAMPLAQHATNAQLEQQLALKERFMRIASHDLRNPLTAVAGFIELAADSPEVVAAPMVAAALADNICPSCLAVLLQLVHEFPAGNRLA